MFTVKCILNGVLRSYLQEYDHVLALAKHGTCASQDIIYGLREWDLAKIIPELSQQYCVVYDD